MVTERSKVLSAKGKPRKVSAKMFKKGKITLVGNSGPDDILFNLRPICDLISTVVMILESDPTVAREEPEDE